MCPRLADCDAFGGCVAGQLSERETPNGRRHLKVAQLALCLQPSAETAALVVGCGRWRQRGAFTCLSVIRERGG